MLSIEQMTVCRGSDEQGFKVSLPELEVQPGDLVALTGLSGCGKSTLLEAIGLILQPSEIQRYRLGQDETDIVPLLLSQDQRKLAELRARHLGFVLQTGGLLPFLSVRLNIALPRRLLGLPEKSELVDRAIEQLGLEGLLDYLPSRLSIGERQRVAFVRAIAHQPQLLLADEPTAALDPQTARHLFQLMTELVKELNIAAIIVSHDWQLVEQFGVRRLSGHPDGRHGTRFLPEQADA